MFQQINYLMVKKKIYSENSKICTLNNYGATKSKAESIIKKVCKKYIILRSNFFCWSINNKNLLSQIIKNLKIKKFLWLEKCIFLPLYTLER